MTDHANRLDQGWGSDGSGFGQLFSVAMRNLVFIIAFPAIAIAIAFAYIVVATPQYSSSSLLYFDIQSEDANQIDTILSSHAVAIASADMTEAVVEQLSLSDRIDTDPGRFDAFVDRLRVQLGLATPVVPSEDEAAQIVISKVSSALDVGRVGDTSILQISYASAYKTDAADIANAYASIYLQRLRDDAKRSTVRRAKLLEDSASEAVRLSADAYRSAQRLRSAASVDLGSVAEFDARLIELKKQLSQLDAEEAALRAKLDMVSPDNELMALETTAMQFEGGARLFAALSDASKRLDVLQKNPSASVNTAQLESSVDGLRSAFNDMMRRWRNEQNQELRIIDARRESFHKNLSELLKKSSTPGWSEYLLAEHRAEVYRRVHADQLVALEALNSRDLDIRTRILTYAQPSVQASWPNPKLIFAFAAVAGLLLGLSLAMWREWRQFNRAST